MDEITKEAPESVNTPPPASEIYFTQARIMTISTFVIAVASVISFSVAFFQWRIMSETLAQMRLDKRAWVGAVEVHQPKNLEEDKILVKAGHPIKSGIVIVNSGQTPAKKLNGYGKIVIEKSDAKIVPQFDLNNNEGKRKSDIVMLPQARTVIETSLNGLAIKGIRIPLDDGPPPEISVKESEIIASQSMVDNLKNGNYILYMYGLVTYEDIFGNAHQTKMCFFLNKDLSTFSGCGSYNEAD